MQFNVRLFGASASARGRWSGSFGASRSGGLQTNLALLSLAVGVYVVASTTAMVIYAWSAVPYWDQWDESILSPKQLFSPWIYSQHNEHRILVQRLLIAIDTFGFGETNKFTFFAT